MNNYHLYEELHKSASATVYKARRRGTIQYVTVKCVDKSRRSAMLAEVSSMSELKGVAGVIEFLCWYETRNHFWLCEEYCPGGDLGRILACDKKFPDTALRDLGIGIARALHGAHLRGVVHRGLTLDSVLFGEGGAVRLGGWAKSAKLGSSGGLVWGSGNLSESEDLSDLGQILLACAGDKGEGEFGDLINLLLSGTAQWEAVNRHSFWQGQLIEGKPTAPIVSSLSVEEADVSMMSTSRSKSVFACNLTTPQSPPLQDMDISTVIADRAIPVTESVSTSYSGELSFSDTLAQVREMSRKQLLGKPSVEPISEDFAELPMGNNSIAGVSPFDIVALVKSVGFFLSGGGFFESLVSCIVKLAPSHAGAILQSEICSFLVKGLSGREAACVSQLIGFLLRFADRLTPPLWGLPEALAKAALSSNDLVSAKAAAAFGEFLFCVSGLPDGGGWQASELSNVIKSFLSSSASTYMSGIRTIVNVSIQLPDFARKHFYSEDLLTRLISTALAPPAVFAYNQPAQIFSAFWFLARADAAASERHGWFNDMEISCRAVERFTNGDTAYHALGLLSWQLRKMGDSNNFGRVGSVLSGLAAQRGGSAVFYAISEFFAVSPEAAILAGGCALDRRRRVLEEDGVSSFLALVSAAAREGRMLAEIFACAPLAGAVLSGGGAGLVLKAAQKQGPNIVGCVAEGLAGRSAEEISMLWPYLANGFLAAVAELGGNQNAKIRFQGVKAFSALVSLFLSSDGAKSAVGVACGCLLARVTSKWLSGLEDPLPALVLRLIADCAVVDNAKTIASLSEGEGRLAGLMRFCENKSDTPQGLNVLAFFAENGVFTIWDNAKLLHATCRAVASARTGDLEEQVAEAAACLIVVSLRKGNFERHSKILATLVCPLIGLLKSFAWSTELLMLLCQHIPKGLLSQEDTQMVAAGLEAVGDDWQAAYALLTVADYIGRTENRYLTRAVADFLLSKRDRAPPEITQLSKRVFRTLSGPTQSNLYN